MKTRIFFLSFVITLLIAGQGHGQVNITVRDPFIPQIPIIKPEPPPTQEIKPPEPIVITPPITPVEPPPVVREKPKPPQLNISGIVWNTERPQAIVNGQVITVGDTISAFTITKIDKNGIILSNGEDEYMVPY